MKPHHLPKNSSTSLRSLAILALGTALSAVFSATASAQNFYQRNMVDFDQRRVLLPNFGNMYCVPTAYSDIFRFMANNGMPGMDAGWGVSYSQTTDLIATIGNEMGTDAFGGTSDPFSVMVDWTAAHTSKLVIHIGYGPKTNFGPATLKSLAGMGAMATVTYGRYYRDNTATQISNKWIRKSGHCLALAGYDWTAATKKIIVADPAADDGNILVQGPYSMDSREVTSYSLTTTDNDVLHLPRYTNWTGKYDTARALIDQVHAMLPVWAGWFTVPAKTSKTAGLRAAADDPKPVFHASFPFQLEDGINRPVHDISVELPGPVRDWCMDHGAPAIYVLGTDDVVSRVDLFSKETARIAVLAGAKKLAVAGANLDLYALVEGRDSDQLVRIDRNTGVQTRISVPKGISGIEPNPATRGILALYPERKAMVSFDELLRGAETRGVKLPEGTGTPYFTVDEAGIVTLGRDGAKSLVQMLGVDRFRTIPLNSPMALRDFQSEGKNRFVAQDGDRLVTFDGEGHYVQSQFEGMSVPTRVRFAQSWRAFHTEDFKGRGWINELPTRESP